MKWFDRWFFKKCHEAWNYYKQESQSPHYGGVLGYSNPILPAKLTSKKQAHISDPHFNTHPMMFKLHSASGGWVVEYNFYDEGRDENLTTLHIVNGDEELGTALSKIITFEALKK